MDHTMRINSLPSITWNRMNINDVTVDWPESSALTPVFIRLLFRLFLFFIWEADFDLNRSL